LQKYVNAALFVLLSKHEATESLSLESLTAGVPCLVANASGLTGWINNIHCFVIDLPINIDELATRLTDCMGKRIFKPSLPSWADVANRVMKIYDSVV
jgi:1,2-diacylglycerol 3-alpha-glucosyltransferase